jgi:hypothetical protein
MADTMYAEISFDGRVITILGHDTDSTPPDGLVMTDSGIQGWFGAPDIKVSQTERQTGNGAHDVPDDELLYAARTVTMGVAAVGDTRQEVIEATNRLLDAMGRTVSLRVADDGSDTHVDAAHCRIEWEADWAEGFHTGTLTVVCPRPERLSTAPCVGLMTPGGDSGLGLVFDSTGVLGLPISFGTVSEATNACTVTNSGTSAASPLIEVSGDMPDGVTITDVATGRQLAYGQPVRWQPLVLDCRSRTASVAGVDVTRGLTVRQWPTVPARGSLSLAVSSGGTGTVKVTCHDTYI